VRRRLIIVLFFTVLVFFFALGWFLYLVGDKQVSNNTASTRKTKDDAEATANGSQVEMGLIEVVAEQLND
jgi:hypothetical protein